MEFFVSVAFIVAIFVGGIFGITYLILAPIIDDQNRRIQESKFRNPEVYGTLPDKLFPWDRD